jgi:hypothetical protein
MPPKRKKKAEAKWRGLSVEEVASTSPSPAAAADSVEPAQVTRAGGAAEG